MKHILIILLIISTQTLFGQENKTPYVYDDGTTRIKLGGFVQGMVAKDFGGAINNHDFIVSSLSVPENWQQQSRLAFDASVSRVNLAVTHKTNSFWDIQFLVETDFRTDGNLLRLRHAYISVLGFTAGQTWSFMYDNDAMAPTIDVQGVNSRTFYRTPLIGYTHKFGAKFSAGISVEMPSARITTSSVATTDPVTGILTRTDVIIPAAQTIPDIPAFIQFKTPKCHFRLAGVLRTINYGHSPQEKIKTKQGLGGQLSGSFKPVSALTVFGHAIYGKGIARYINDLRTGSFDLMTERRNPDNIDALTMYSASIGVRADISPKIYLSSNFSIAEVNKDEKFVRDSDYRYGTYFSGTFFWRAYGNLLFAAEYLHGYRQNMNSDSGNANRIQTMLRYSF